MENITVFEQDSDINVYKHLHTFEEPPHKHSFFEIEYVYCGSGLQYINGKEFPVKKGDLLLLGFNDLHSFKPNGEIGILNCLVKPAFISQTLNEAYDISDIVSLAIFKEFQVQETVPVLRFSSTEQKQIEELLIKMVNENAQADEGYLHVLHSYFDILLIMICRQIKAKGKREPISNKMLIDVIKHIEENYSESIKLSELAATCFYNPAYLSRIFKEAFGKTVTEYVQEVRINEAIKLLLKTDMSVGDIADKVGFSNRKLFYKVFKDKVGRLPVEYRRVARSSEPKVDKL